MKVPRELRSMVRKWQKLLGLSQWDISVEVSPLEFSSTNASADVDIEVVMLAARITFYQSAFDEDLLELLIHELVHLHLAHFNIKEGSTGEIVEENAVYAISRCIAKLATELEA